MQNSEMELNSNSNRCLMQTCLNLVKPAGHRWRSEMVGDNLNTPAHDVKKFSDRTVFLTNFGNMPSISIDLVFFFIVPLVTKWLN